MEQQASKDFFRLNRGLNTEINELSFPDGFTTDEANYELLVDGSRRRRKGLAAEASAGSAKTIDTLGTGYRNQTYLWENVGGDPAKRVMVFRTGDYIYFADADSIVSNGWASGTGSFVQLDAYRSDDATDALVQKGPLTFSQGRGHLFVTGQYIYPFYISYDSAADEYASHQIQIYVRDYSTIEDGVAVNSQPTGDGDGSLTSITADHYYNLRNRGWSEDDISQYDSDQTAYPARNMSWFKAYKRVADESTASAVVKEGTRVWDSDKLSKEGFGSSSSPVGSLFLDPTDTTIAFTKAGASATTINVTTWTVNTSTWAVTLTLDGLHGLSAGDTFTLSGLTFDWERTLGGEIIDVLDWGAWNKTWTITSETQTTDPAANNTITFTASALNNWTGWIDQYKTLGYLGDPGGLSLTRSTGTDHGDSWAAVEFHAGRVFYAGMKNTEFNDWVMFSQIADSTGKYGRCHQEADPTDENFSALTSADGGYVTIPGLGGIINMVSVRNSLLVLSNRGVWEISGGQRGVFTADGYSVRQITSTPAIGADGVAVIDDSLIYASPDGIYIIAPNQYTGVLEAQSITENTIQTLWNDIPTAEQERIQFAYDPSMKRLYMMYGPDGSSFGIDTMLIFDARTAAIFKYTFDTPTNNVLMTGLAIPNVDTTSNNNRMKFIYEVSTTSVQVADFNQTSFNDWDGTNGPLPYLVFGHDNIGDWQKRRQAPVITVYSQRTETGYTSTGNGWAPVNGSSTLMSVYWDWTDDAVTNKITAQQEVYRHVRNFVPSAADDVDGYPVVVTRNKVRGRGRSLQMRFDGATDKDSHILGYTVNYKVSRQK